MRPTEMLPAMAGVLSLARWGTLLLLAAGLLVLAMPEPTRAATARYPDLRTLPPDELRFDTVTIDGASHAVLRFSNTVWNAGQGPLELRGDSSTATSKTRVYQRIYNDDGTLAEALVGEFDFHPQHNHWHFGDFAEYELWTKTEYDAWLASGRTQGQAQRRGSKTTFCIMDTRRVERLAGSPSSAGYGGCGQLLQGLSVGWGDTYGYHLWEQWVDLGGTRLPDGQYVLRSIADPRHLLHESRVDNNEAVTVFTVQRGRIKR